MKLLKLTLSVLALGLASTAFADMGFMKGHTDRHYVYINPHGAIGYIHDVDVEGAVVPNETDIEADSKYSYGYGLEVGVAGPFGMSPWRIAGEYSAVKGRVDYFSANGVIVDGTTNPVHGAEAWTINLYYDMMLSESFDLNLGVGIGAASREYSAFSWPEPAVSDPGRKSMVFYWKLMAGLTFWPHDRIGINARYDFGWAGDQDFSQADGQWDYMLMHTFHFGLVFKLDV